MRGLWGLVVGGLVLSAVAVGLIEYQRSRPLYVPPEVVAPIVTPSPPVPPAAVAGDSLADGVAIVLGWSPKAKFPARNQARVGAFTREVQFQLARLPVGITVLVSAGTNDAAGGRLVDLGVPVSAALKVAADRKQTLVWYGPPRFDLPWDFVAADIGEQLRRALAGTPHRYVDTRALAFAAALRSRDRVHFTIPDGYRAFYQRGGYQ